MTDSLGWHQFGPRRWQMQRYGYGDGATNTHYAGEVKEEFGTGWWSAYACPTRFNDLYLGYRRTPEEARALVERWVAKHGTAALD